jgi:hypothetical protein
MRFSWKPLTILGLALAFSAGVAVQPPAAVADLDHAQWKELNSKFKKSFFPLPIKKIFTDSKKERAACRKAPDAAGAIEKRNQAREQRSQMREDIKSVRESRDEVITQLLQANDSRALEALAKGLKFINADLKSLSKTIAEYTKASGAYVAIGGSIQYGTDKGAQEWHQWVKAELAAASAIRTEEIRVKNKILNGFSKVDGGGGMDWLRDALAKNKSEEVRAGAALALGAAKAEGNIPALANAYGKEKNGLVRVAILDGLYGLRAKDQQAVFLAALKTAACAVSSRMPCTASPRCGSSATDCCGASGGPTTRTSGRPPATAAPRPAPAATRAAAATTAAAPTSAARARTTRSARSSSPRRSSTASRRCPTASSSSSIAPAP